jgi:hypothetical protein
VTCEALVHGPDHLLARGMPLRLVDKVSANLQVVISQQGRWSGAGRAMRLRKHGLAQRFVCTQFDPDSMAALQTTLRSESHEQGQPERR